MRTILFVDDHPIFRDGVRRALEAALTDLAVLLQADARGALATLAAGADVDLLLADYRLPDSDGLTLIAAVRRSYPTVGTGLLCTDLTFALLAKARELGAVLCMSKVRATSDLVTAIQTVFDGGHVFDDVVGGTAPANIISARRRQILALASEGLSDRAIGERLHVSENTVRNHWKYIFEQLRVNTRTEAVGKAIRQGAI